MRFLHLADVHLDTPFAGRSSALRQRLREASRQALRSAFDLAIAERVHAVLIAGDLFDGERLSFETEAFLVREFARLGGEGIRVVYATGNHDPGRSGLRALARPWPENVTVVADREPVRLRIRDRERETVGWVTAAGHASPRETLDLARAFPRPVGEQPEVGLLHTQVHGARSGEDHHPYAPSELRHLERAGFDYWALGHVHTRQQLSETPPIHYPGNLQGRTPAEDGPRGGLLVDLTEPDRPRVTFHPFAPVRWETVRVDDLLEAATVEAVVELIRRRWRDLREADRHPGAEDWLVRVELHGPARLWRELGRDENRSALEGELAGALGALDVEVRVGKLHPPVRAEDHLRRRDVLGEALRLAQAVREGEARLEGLAAGELAAAELRPELDPEAWIRELLEDVEPALIARLLDAEALQATAARTLAAHRSGTDPDPDPDPEGLDDSAPSTDRATTPDSGGPDRIGSTESSPVGEQGSLPLGGD